MTGIGLSCEISGLACYTGARTNCTAMTKTVTILNDSPERQDSIPKVLTWTGWAEHPLGCLVPRDEEDQLDGVTPQKSFRGIRRNGKFC